MHQCRFDLIRCHGACAQNRISRTISTLNPLSSPAAKNFYLPFFGKLWFSLHIPPRCKRAFWPIVTEREAGRDGRVGDAREFFVRTNGADADVKARGPDTPTLVSSRRDLILPMM